MDANGRQLEYRLSDLIDLAELRELMEAFHRATGINHALLDNDGTLVVSAGWQMICDDFHRQNPQSKHHCLLDHPASWKCRPGQTYVGHCCRNGLCDYATPVIIDGREVGNLFTGQILHEPPDLEFFRRQAADYGFDEAAYLDAVRRTPIIPRARIPHIMAFLACLARILGTKGMALHRQEEAEKDLQLLNRELSKRVQERTAELSEKNRLLLLKEERLQWSHDLLAKLSEQVPGVLFQYRVSPDGHSCFPFANQAMQEIYELSPEQVREDASVLAALHHQDDAKGILASLRKSARTLEPWHYEYRVILPKQGMRWRLGNARPERLPDGGTLWHGFITDITERKELEQELERQAHLDYLTGLANRRHFMDLAERELSRTVRYGSPLSVLMLDLDHFKEVNDTYGHKIGDLALQQSSETCRGMLREADIMGRLGGEEFAILLPLADGTQALDIAERLRQAIADQAVATECGSPLRITVSIGVAQLAATDANIDFLLSHADHALYEAKRTGRNKVCLYCG